MPFSEMLLPEFDEEMKNTRKLLECVPDNNFAWKPHEKSMALGRLATHIAELPGYGTVTVTTPSFDVAGHKSVVCETKGEVLAEFDKNAGEARAAIAAASDETLLQPWSLIFGGQVAFTLPRVAVIRTMMMNHLIHHRGQLGVYLRLNDVAIPGMYGPSADAKAFAG